MIIKGDLHFQENYYLESLGDLTEVLGRLTLTICDSLGSLGKLKNVRGTLQINRNQNLKNLGDLEEVGASLYLTNCPKVKSLGKLKDVKNEIFLKGSGITEEYVKKNKPQLLSKCNWNRIA